MTLRNIGIVAHVDAGKTTTTEHMLYESGRIRSLGRVDTGTAQTDWLDVERERGISVRAATTVFEWKGCKVNLIDTPGHVDFSSEVERSLRVLDGAILIVSAVEGVQAHTETLWNALKALKIPALIVINKMDRLGASAERVLHEVRSVLTAGAIPVQRYSGCEDNFDGVESLWTLRAEHSGSVEAGVVPNAEPAAYFSILEQLADHDDRLLQQYIEGEHVPATILFDRLRELTLRAVTAPVLFAAASKGIGIAELMDAVIAYLPPPAGSEDDPLSGVVFKLERDKTMGKLAHVRLYGGRLQNRDTIRIATQELDEKVTQIRKVHAGHHEDIGVLRAGDIAAVCGLSRVKIGDVIGSAAAVPPEHRLTVPLLTVQVHPADDAQYAQLVAALQELADEDPLLDLQWHQQERELHIKITGPIQLEVLAHQLLSRFGLKADFGAPSVIYKETPSGPGYGYVAYTMPKPCWAILRFMIEPGERGSGLRYSSQVKPEDLLQSYQNEVARRVPEALMQGLFGWEVTDLKVTLVEGQHHVWHTHPLDFVLATPMGIMDGLSRTQTTLLEPYLHFRITAPGEASGKVLNELNVMRALFDYPVVAGERFTVEGTVPVASSLDFPVKLSTLTGGRGTFATRFDGYRECPPGVEVTRKRSGVNPLDTSKYILSMRSALGSTR
ncbi:GTP-binding protein [Paenibacillus piri]|uniref:TetM/TetW/TetO/TetS family tetracycline resistance ribosomal protection protein n=1 Tax=Paenibacillus piri TaxID=2547395 RepID=A0A4R5KVR2_9BACL|nr:TetM/TetW/TetO/TetS family tetracycline resistance ribosomal protection protein [Paenibacillus piri]TDF99205.1 TetM/TetW/TetO/TetS family tetracycline resistance ribosomal protection protein [Paenibacillus piri]